MVAPSPPSVDPFSAIADPTRRQLLVLLAHGDLPVKQLSAAFAVSRPAISQHLRVLREAGLVSERKVGRERHYYLRAAPLQEVADWVRQYEPFWRDRLDTLGTFLDTQP